MLSTRGPVFQKFFLSWLLLTLTWSATLFAQSGGRSGTVVGTVTDGSGAVVSNASVSIQNPVSGYVRTVQTDTAGRYEFSNVPFDSYHLVISASGFGSNTRDVDVRSTVAISLTDTLKVGTTTTSVTVDANDLLANDTSFHTDVDRGLFEKLPLESQSSSVSSLVTLSSPGVAADSNGLFHGLGDHASNSFSIDGQPITDQQSKIFSNQIPSNSVQSIEVISGAPPAEFGGKTSLVIQVTTRSGQGATTPTGLISTSYGTFGSATGAVDLSYGGKNWGNFIEIDGLNTGRFLDPPEFKVFHDKGNEQNAFDRVDYNFTPKDAVHINFNYSRSWFQTPNTYDNLNVQNVLSGGTSSTPVLGSVGNTDQRSQIGTFDIAPTYTRVINSYAVFNFGPYVRRDAYNYYPSGNLLADRGPEDLQTSSISQFRTLTNAGVHTDVSYSRGIHTIKIGANYSQTFLRENDTLGVVDPIYSLTAPCVDGNGNPLPGYSDPNACGDNFSNPSYLSVLAPYDLTRGGSSYNFTGQTDVKEIALYAQDQITAGDWLFNLGMRGDFYNGLTITRQAEPRVGVSYKIKPSSTVLRISYARTLETPFNENLVLSSTGCLNPVLNPLLVCQASSTGTLEPGFRNEFHAGFQQAFGKNVVVSGDYIWKYTHNAFDFSILGNTPITFPIDWHNSKIPGFALRTDVPNFHNFSAFVVMSSVAARFFPPQVAGAGATVGQTGLPFRIDHDEKYNQTTHVQYQMPFKLGPWVGFNWRYDSGLVAGSAPCYGITDPNSPCLASSTQLDGQPAIEMVNPVGIPLTADEEFQAGFACNGVKAAVGAPLPSVCLASQFTSSLIGIPAPNKGDNDTNPQRIAPRSLFDASIGEDNLFHGEKDKWSLRLSAVNISNKYALYNFLSTFSGTHYVTPRALTAEIGFHF